MKVLRVACALVLAFSLTGCVVAIGTAGKKDDLEKRVERIERHLGIEGPAEDCGE